MSRHQLGTLFALSFAFSLPLLACGADNDILPDNGTGAPPATQTNTDPQTNSDPQTNTDPQANEDLSHADQLTSGDTATACEPSACGTPAVGTSCCTTADDVTANHAVVAGHCGIDMSAFNVPGCTQKDQPGVLDEACPMVTIPPGPPMQGCCTASGHCGAMESFLGFGCSSNPDATTWQPCGQ